MKRLTLALVGLYMGTACGFSQFSFTSLSVSEAMKAAQEEKKFLVVYFNNAGCYPCQQAESTTFSASGLPSFDSETMMIVQADLNEQTFNEMKSITEVTSIPSAVILYPNGDLYSTLNGTYDIENYLDSYMSSLSYDYEYYVQKSETEAAVRSMVKEYKAGKRGADFLQELLNQLAAARDNYYLYDYEFDVYTSDIISEYFSSVTPEQVFSTEKGFYFWKDNETKILSPRSEYLLKNMDSFYLKYGSEVSTKIKSLLKTELYNLGSSKDNYGLGILENHILSVTTSPVLKEEFAGYFKRIKKEMKKDNIDYYFWNDYSYDYYDYEY